MDESMLTGEALPLSKSCPEHMDEKVYTPMMKKCTLYADTLCLKSNDAIASVGKTGMFTMKGELLQALIMPVLDNQLKAVSPLLHPPRSSATPLTEAEALDLVKDCFASAGERDIFTGDSVDICIINAAGIRHETLQLKLD
jgi:20S proteasome subunit beta 6